jgi:hypothetical protein
MGKGRSRKILVAGVAAGAAVVLAAAPASASSAGIGTAGSESGGTAGAVTQLASPSKVEAGSAYVYAIKVNKCFANYQNLTVRQTEKGQSGTVRFRQLVSGQYLTTGGWRQSGSQKVAFSNSFPNNAKTFYFGFPWKYSYGNTAAASHRIVIKLDWLAAGGGVIATKTLTQTCA